VQGELPQVTFVTAEVTVACGGEVSVPVTTTVQVLISFTVTVYTEEPPAGTVKVAEEQFPLPPVGLQV
jgi:hypothetical protein